MAIINLLNIASRNRPDTNPLTTAARTLAAGVDTLAFRIITDSQPAPNPTWLGDATKGFRMWLEESPDGGTTWQFSAGYQDFPIMCGGHDRQGNPINPTLTVTDVSGKTMRGHLETLNGPIRFGVEVETNPAG